MIQQEWYPELGVTAEAITDSTAEQFWLDPAVIRETAQLIKHTHLATMDLGARTQHESALSIRQLLGETLIDSTIDTDAQADYQRAIDVGFMYGRLIAQRTMAVENLSVDYNTERAKNIIGRLQQRVGSIDITQPEDDLALFRILREIELSEAHSDVLAFCLLRTQPHISKIFADHQAAAGVTQDMLVTPARIQSVFYAGALLGAVIAVTPDRLTKPRLEVLRGITMPKVDEISHKQ